ncbi:MAG: glycosyltransferase [Homoserinimonas sp.]
MKVALTTNVLAIPPTYFVVNHAQRLASRHQFEVFALMADIQDPTVSIPVHDYAAFPALLPARRVYLAPFAGRAMSRGIEKYAPDIIHQHFATWSGPALAAAKHSRVPLVTTLHGYDVRALARTAKNPMDLWHRRNVRAIQKRSSRVLGVSKYLADEAIAVGFDARRLDVHYQGIDTDYFTPADDRGVFSNPPIISFVGALSAHKGPLDLVRASLQLIDRHDHRLQLIGAGPLEREIREISRNSSHIELLGKVPKDAVRETLRSSQAMVLPSKRLHGGSEAAGLVLLEAQACGTPVVAYDSGGIAEMMDVGTTGALVQEGDERELTNALREMLQLSSAERTRIGVAARHFVETQRSLKVSAIELERHYLDLI